MILVVGCGYIGEPLADLLHSQGHSVLGVTHRMESALRLASEKPWRAVACDISSASSVQDLLAAEPVAMIIHCASSSKGGEDAYRAVYRDGLQHLLTTFPAARVIFVSSTSVYTQLDGSSVSEDAVCEPTRENGKILREAEEMALAKGGIVARLAGIYGPGRSVLLKNLLAKKSVIEGGGGEGRIVNQIHQVDAVSALAHLAGLLLNGRAQGIFNVVDDKPMAQRELFLSLAPKFNAAMPPVGEPDTQRKRPYSSKAVSNAKLRATGWSPRYKSYLDAVTRDPLLASSVLEQLLAEGVDIPRAPNIVIIGLMGCGKSTVGKLVVRMIGFQLEDTDQVVTRTAKRKIPAIFEAEGEAGFRQRETRALLSMLGRRGHVIATGGGIITQPRNLPLLKHLGFIVWLDADPKTLARRTASSNDRPLLRTGDPEAKLASLLEERGPIYKQMAVLRIKTAELSPQETAYGIMESAKLHFTRL